MVKDGNRLVRRFIFVLVESFKTLTPRDHLCIISSRVFRLLSLKDITKGGLETEAMMEVSCYGYFPITSKLELTSPLFSVYHAWTANLQCIIGKGGDTNDTKIFTK